MWLALPDYLHPVVLSTLAARFAVAEGAVTGACLLAVGCGTMLMIAGAVGFWLVHARRAEAASASMTK